MIVPKRMALQLTPLLDLLLIVIFAQYLEVQETHVEIEQTAESAIQERDAAIAELAQVQKQVELVTEQQQTIERLVEQIFEIPQNEFSQAVREQLRATGRSQAEMDHMQQRIRELTQNRSERVVQHLLEYEEIRKHCDLWELHVNADQFLVLSNGEKTLRMQIPLNREDEFVQQEFSDQFLELVRKLPEPKSLVVILFTRDFGAPLWAEEGVQEVLGQVVTRLNYESAGRSRYTYADMGFRIE